MKNLNDMKNFMKSYLVEGEYYGINKVSRDSLKRKEVTKRKMRLVKKHQNFALFEDKNGATECIQYRDLYKQIICGEEEPYVY